MATLAAPTLAAKTEARLKRDHNRRASSVSQASKTYNLEERQEKMIAQESALEQELERAEENATTLDAKALEVRERAKTAKDEQAKALSSSMAMRKLLLQLEERKLKLLERREALFEEDSSERAKMSERLQTHIAERSSRAAAAEEEADKDPNVAECVRLREALHALADDFEAKHVAHEANLLVSRPVSRTLEAALKDAQASLTAAEARAAEQQQLRDAIEEISSKINGFVEQAGASRENMSARTEKLGAETDRRRDAALAVSDLKAARANTKKDLAAAEELKALKEEKIKQAEATLVKLKALQKTLSLQAGPEEVRTQENVDTQGEVEVA